MFRLLTVPLLASLLLGCHQNYSIIEHSDLNLPCGGDNPKVVIEMMNGPITITTAKCKDITGQLTKRGVGFDKEEAEKELAAIAFDSKIIDGKIIVKAKRIDGNKSWNGSGTEAELQLPVGSQVELITSNGSIHLTGKCLCATAKTSNGGITIEGTNGTVDITTSNGAVRCTELVGPAKVVTSNGSINLSGRNLVLDCKSNNGSIECTGSLGDGQHKLVTSNAHIRMKLPTDVQGQLDANTSNGKITSEFKLDKSEANRKNTSLKGWFGTSASSNLLTLKTSNASISIKKDKSKDSTTVVSDDE